MATEVVTVLRDDIDGTPADRTVSFGWAGAGYEIDLNQKNLAAFEAALAPYVAVARRAGGRRAGGRGRRLDRTTTRGRAGTSGAAPAGLDLAAVRTWASANGHAVAARGRISATILDAYQSASANGSAPSEKAPGRKRTAAKAAGSARGRRRTASAKSA